MKYECLKSHEQPGSEPGKFTRYEAGMVCELDEAEPSYFRAVYGNTDGKEKASLAKAQSSQRGTLKQRP